MSYQVLARKYRPQKFSDVIGQDHVTRTLQNAIAQERIAHGYIFSGHRGIGKTTVARILAMALNCRSSAKPPIEPCGICESCTEIRNGNSVDVIEIDAATNRASTRSANCAKRHAIAPLVTASRSTFSTKPPDHRRGLQRAAQNLEEPPSHVVFMMATTQPEDIPQTIRSRCQHFSYRAMKFDAVMGNCATSSPKRAFPPTKTPSPARRSSDGSMRDALSILDQAIASTADHLTATRAQPDRLRSRSRARNGNAAVAESSSERILVLVDE